MASARRSCARMLCKKPRSTHSASAPACQLARTAQVVCTDATLAAAERARAAGCPLWRVSSTVFAHVASDEVLTPLGAFAGGAGAAAYPPTPAGLQVQRELEAIQLKAP